MLPRGKKAVIESHIAAILEGGEAEENIKRFPVRYMGSRGVMRGTRRRMGLI
jgi:hypothetical protein